MLTMDWTFEDGALYRLSNGRISCGIAPMCGMNVCELSAFGERLVAADPRRKLAGKTYGISILYPTPNRVRDGRIRWGKGLESPGRGHGFARNAAFEVVGVKQTPAGGSVEGRLQIREDECPIRHELRVCISLDGDELLWRYQVLNEGDRPLPYGFGLHPFFLNPGELATVRVDSCAVMARGADGEFAGRLTVPPKDLRTPGKIAEMNLNDAYFLRTGYPAQIAFDRLTLMMQTSEEFAYAVVYTPDRASFCVENQTCAPDAHYLFGEGFEREAALQWAAPLECRSGFVRWKFIKTA